MKKKLEKETLENVSMSTGESLAEFSQLPESCSKHQHDWDETNWVDSKWWTEELEFLKQIKFCVTQNMGLFFKKKTSQGRPTAHSLLVKFDQNWKF